MDVVEKVPVWRRGIVETVIAGVLAWNLLVFGTSPGLGWAIAVVVGIWLVWRMIPDKVMWQDWVAVIGTLAALLVGGRANGFVQGYNGMVAGGSLAVLLVALIVHRCEWKVEKLIGYMWEIVVDAWDHTWAVLGAYKKGAQPTATGRMGSIIKTAIISIILLVVFGAILSAADPVFGRELGKIFENSGGRIVTSVVGAIVIVWWLTVKITSDKHGEKWLKWIGFYELVIPIGLVGVLVGIFLAFQTRYLFATHASFLAFPESYSEYVRKGFSELMLATALGGGLSYGVWLLTQTRVDETARRLAGWINSIWLVEIALLLVSAAWRNGLYIDAYGYTRTRLIGEGFLIWLAGGLVALLALVLIRRARAEWLVVTLGVMTILVGGYFNVVNMDAKILAKQPQRWEQKDVFYISNLSEDGIEGWRDVVMSGEQVLHDLRVTNNWDKDNQVRLASLDLAVDTLLEKRMRLEKKYGENLDIRQFNWAEFEALNKMRYDQEMFYTRLDKLNLEVDRFVDELNVSISDDRSWILYDFDYPFVDVRMRD